MTSDGLPTRLGSVDLIRGLALLGMVVFHTAWDLHAFGLTQLDPSRSTLWHGFGHAVAGCFLFLSGLSLVLARDRGVTIGASLKRIGLIALSALAVTLATWFVAPEQAIVFGVLHCIALSNLIALALLRLPVWSMLIVAMMALTAKVALAPVAPTWTWWIGLSDTVPDTLDYRPLCPWLAVVLAGCIFGKCGGPTLLRQFEERRGLVPAALKTAGRNSLVFYLVHQPFILICIIGLTALPFASVARSIPEVAERDFVEACDRKCSETGFSIESCAPICLCVSLGEGSHRRPADTHRMSKENTLAQEVETCMALHPASR